MSSSGLLIDLVTSLQDGHILSGMPLVRRDIVDGPILVLMVVPTPVSLELPEVVT